MADDLEKKLQLDEAAPVERIPKISFHVANAQAFEAWCAERGFDPETYLFHFESCFKPRAWDE